MKTVIIQTKNIGFRAKTWSSLLFGSMAAANFLITCFYWPPSAKWPIHIGFVGYLMASTLGLFFAAISEARKKKEDDNKKQIIIKQGGAKE